MIFFTFFQQVMNINKLLFDNIIISRQTVIIKYNLITKIYSNLHKMSQWLKLVQCKYTPTPTFCLFDYTKIVYPIDSTFYIKQIITAQQKSSFIEINHQFDSIVSLHASLNNVITVQRRVEYFYVCFYALENQEIMVRINLGIQGNGVGISVKSIYVDNLLILCFGNYENSCSAYSNQIIFINCQTKAIVGRGFLQGKIHDYCKGPNSSISLWVDNKIVAYRHQMTASPDIIGRIYKQTQVELPNNLIPQSISLNTSMTASTANCQKIQHHFWIQDQLFLWGKTKAYIIIKNKICQQFEGFHRLHNAAALVCGFIVCDGCIIKVYKKKNIRYQKICEIIDQNLMDCKNLMLSGQEDILAYYSPISNGLVVSKTFSKQVQEAQNNQNAMQMAIVLGTTHINHNKNYDYTIYTSSQPWFATVSSTTIKLLSSHNYQQYLTVQLSDKSSSTFINSDLKPRYLAIHPNRPIFAVALKKMVRIYFVTFNEIKIIKEISVSLAGYLLFNHSGSLLTIVVAGKGGAKLYVYKINQFKSDYTLLETITVGKKLVSILWDNLDTTLYYFFDQGYYTWTLQSKLKSRKQHKITLNFPLQNVLLSKQDTPILYSPTKIIQLLNQSQKQEQQLKIKDVKIKNVFLQEQYYYVVFDNGKVGRNKILDIQDCYAKALNFNNVGRKFEIRLQENNKFIYLSQDLNVKFYTFANNNNINGYIDIVGIEKKKLYNIMSKHKQYQNTIKSIKQQYSSIILQYKQKTLQQEQQIEQQYKTQLNEHIQKQSKLKEQKIKEQQRYQKNLQIKQKQSMNQIKQLQKLYQRKIALTTNKLLTEKEIGFRQRSMAQDQLKILQQKHYQDVQEIRKQFGEYIKNQMLDKNQAMRQINNIKKDYQTRLYELSEENQILLKSLQEKNQSSIIGLKKIVNNWENKYSQCVSQKDNIQKQFQQQAVKCEKLKQKLQFVQIRKIQAERRSQSLCLEITKLQKILQQRNVSLQFYEKRIEDMQKSNEILKYRVLEVKEQNDPYESEIEKLKQNLNDLEEEYEKIIKSSHEQQQKMQIIKKQKSKLKQDYQIVNQKFFKLSKRYEELIDKVRQTTKSPIQQIRRQLLNIVQNYARGNKSHTHMQKRTDSPLGELNRIRDHLEVCLGQAVNTNKKNDEQRKIQVMKKNRQNSQLITQINNLRKKIRILEDQIKQKDLKISRLLRGQTPTIVSKQQQIQTTEAQSKQFTKTRSRQTFYEKNTMFKSNMQWNKRLKTQEGSRRKKSSHSMLRDKYQHSLAIQSQGEQIQQYKRIIEQKDIFIQKLIAKIQKG